MPTLDEWLKGETCDGVPLDSIKVAAYRKAYEEHLKNPPPAFIPCAMPFPVKKQEPPPMIIQGWNFAAAMVKWSLCGFKMRTKRQIRERLKICQGCEFLANDHCTKCGCACVEKEQLMNKLALASESCPEGKWK